MNQTTQEVIEFLNHPDLDFGVNATDAELLGDPELLCERVHTLLEDVPVFLRSREEGEELRARLGEADWLCIAQEFQARLKVASSFFGRDIDGVA